MHVEDRYYIRVTLVALPMISWVLQQVLNTSFRVQLVASVSGLQDAAPQIAQQAQQADVVVVDLDDPGQIPQLVALVSHPMRARVLVLTTLQDEGALVPAIVAGLRGIVRKSDPPQSLLMAIQRVHAGDVWLDCGAASRVFMELTREKNLERDDAERAKIALLTGRERQAIAALLADTAAPAKVVARRLSISEHTLRNHLTSIYSKLNVSNRLDLYAYATRHRIEKQLR